MFVLSWKSVGAGRWAGVRVNGFRVQCFSVCQCPFAGLGSAWRIMGLSTLGSLRVLSGSLKGSYQGSYKGSIRFL